MKREGGGAGRKGGASKAEGKTGGAGLASEDDKGRFRQMREGAQQIIEGGK